MYDKNKITIEKTTNTKFENFIETKENILKDVVPLSISRPESIETERHKRCIAAITIIAHSNEMSDKINAILHEYSELLIGRMGMPYKECGLYIINITLDGMEEEILKKLINQEYFHLIYQE